MTTSVRCPECEHVSVKKLETRRAFACQNPECKVAVIYSQDVVIMDSGDMICLKNSTSPSEHPADQKNSQSTQKTKRVT
jgi:hypothetical protein